MFANLLIANVGKTHNLQLIDTRNQKVSYGILAINTGLSIAGSSGGGNQTYSTILYVHSRNSREGKSTSGGKSLCSPPSK